MTSDQFKQTFLPYHEKMYALALRIMGTSMDAEDVVQDTFLKMWQKKEKLPLDGNLAGYCLTLTKRQCIDRLRRSHLKTIDSEPSESDIDNTEDIHLKIEARESYENAMQLVYSMPDNLKRVIILRDIEKMDYSDIAQCLGLTEINVRVTLSRARKLLKKLMINKGINI